VLEYLRTVFGDRNAMTRERRETADEVKARHRGRRRGGRVHIGGTPRGGFHKTDSPISSGT
jgi:hypothetical protein